jgi:squalene synthase HpnC
VIRRGSPAPVSPEQHRVLAELAARAQGQAGAENFPVAMRILPRRAREPLLHVYRYARFVDDVGDIAVGDRLALLDAVETDVRALWTGTAALAPVAGLAPLVANGLPAQPLLDLIQANRMDQTVQSYGTFDDLLGYCQYSAAPVGQIVLHVAGQVTAQNVAASDVVCNALQVLEHCQDVGEDARAGRVYLPGEDLRAEQVSPASLRSAVAPPALRRVIALQVQRARTMLEVGDALVARLRGWPRLAVAGYVAGGRATADALQRADYEVLGAAVRPTKIRTLRRVAPLLVAR